MQFNQSIILFSLFTAIIASPILESPLSSNIITRGTSISEAAYDIKRDDDAPFSLEKRSELSIRQAPTLKDVTCPDNKKTYTAETIKEAIKTENAKASPGQYGNQEGGKKLFAVDTQLYKASLDNVARAVFSRNANNGYVYRGVIEHDKGTGNGFHKC